MERGEEMKPHTIGLYMKLRILLILIPALLLTGCFTRAKTPYIVEQYILEYSSPVFKDHALLDESIKIERFSTAQSFNSTAMVYKPHAFKLAVYNYNRWRVTPGDMVTDYLLRDLRNSGLFRAVLSYRDVDSTRFTLEGVIEEFLELDEGSNGKAILSLNIALLDQNQKEITRKVIFQKGYRLIEPQKEQTPEGLAQGMSAAMARLSEQLINDIYSAVKNRGH
jgi:cholesterol transport system auxiliary component